MWKKLGDLSAKRNIWEALLFYLIYGSAGVFLCGVITSMITQISGLSSVEDIRFLAMKTAPIVAGIYTLIVAVSLILFKHIAKDALAILCAILGSLASVSLGLIFGFVPIAFLSGFSPVDNSSSDV